MDIAFLIRVSKIDLPFRSHVPEEIEHIRNLVRDGLVMGYCAHSNSPDEPELGTILAITPDGHAFMAIREAEIARKQGRAR